MKNGFWIMRQYLALYPVFERCNNAPAVGIIFRVGCKYKLNIQRQPEFKPAYLYVAFLQNIKQCYLDTGLEVRQFINDKNPPVRTWNQPEVDNPFIRIRQFEIGCFYRVCITDQVGNADIRGSQFFSISFVTMHPYNRCIIAKFCNKISCKI